jgi:hypothetical protein
MSYIPVARRRKIERDAGFRYGYCRTDQRISSAQMHIEHLFPVAKGGSSDEDNLWLACARCNTCKGDKTHTIDPLTNEEVPLFNPRKQVSVDHFTWSEDGTQIIGLTPIGRATVVTLRLDDPAVVLSRRLWGSAGWHPPKD